MIDQDEEDVEKLLKRKISWKSIIKGVLGLILLVGGVLLIEYFRRTQNSTYMLLGIVLLCMGSSVMVPIPQKKNELRHTISILKCDNCGSERVQDYKEGDFVFKDTEITCRDCSSTYLIHNVYSVKLKSKARKKSK